MSDDTDDVLHGHCVCGHRGSDHDDTDFDEFGILGQCFECNCENFTQQRDEQ